jgi:hypothetical protein
MEREVVFLWVEENVAEVTPGAKSGVTEVPVPGALSTAYHLEEAFFEKRFPSRTCRQKARRIDKQYVRDSEHISLELRLDTLAAAPEARDLPDEALNLVT